MNFFKTFLASMLALTVFTILSLVLFFVVLGVSLCFWVFGLVTDS